MESNIHQPPTAAELERRPYLLFLEGYNQDKREHYPESSLILGNFHVSRRHHYRDMNGDRAEEARKNANLESIMDPKKIRESLGTPVTTQEMVDRLHSISVTSLNQEIATTSPKVMACILHARDYVHMFERTNILCGGLANLVGGQNGAVEYPSPAIDASHLHDHLITQLHLTWRQAMRLIACIDSGRRENADETIERMNLHNAWEKVDFKRIFDHIPRVLANGANLIESRRHILEAMIYIYIEHALLISSWPIGKPDPIVSNDIGLEAHPKLPFYTTPWLPHKSQLERIIRYTNREDWNIELLSYMFDNPDDLREEICMSIHEHVQKTEYSHFNIDPLFRCFNEMPKPSWLRAFSIEWYPEKTQRPEGKYIQPTKWGWIYNYPALKAECHVIMKGV